MKKILFNIFIAFSLVLCFTNVYAASATISANKTSATVGDTVTVTVTINAATWNVTVSGGASDKIVGFDSDAQNVTTTKQYSIDTSKAGTYTVTISGDITDGVTDVNSNVSGSAVITVKEKQTTNTETNNGGSSGNGSSNQTTYTKSSDATLKALKIDIEGLSPSFNKNTYTYTLSVGSDIDSLKVTASTNNSKARYTVSGNTNLKNGDNNVYITVTAENGATKTYKIIVTKAENPEMANAYLENIIVENVKLTTEFSREVLEYQLEDVLYGVEALDISVFPENKNATFVIEGNDTLKVGENEIKIIVTAEDKVTTKEYVLKVNKLEMVEDKNDNTLIDENPLVDTKDTTDNIIVSKLKSDTETQILVLVYILAVVEFFEILYLFFQLREKNKYDIEGDMNFVVSDKEKRRRCCKKEDDELNNAIQNEEEVSETEKLEAVEEKE